MHNDIQYRGVELKLPASVDIDAVATLRGIHIRLFKLTCMALV